MHLVQLWIWGLELYLLEKHQWVYLGKVGHRLSKDGRAGTLKSPTFVCGFLKSTIAFHNNCFSVIFSATPLQLYPTLVSDSETRKEFHSLVVSCACFTSCNSYIEITKTHTSEANMSCPVKLGYNT